MAVRKPLFVPATVNCNLHLAPLLRLRRRFCTSWILPLLPLLLLLWTLPTVAQAQFDYTTNNGTITITRYTGSDRDVTIPSTINGLAVTSIGVGAFSGISVISVTIPGSVTSIGDEAFYSCDSLISVTIPDSVTTIGDEAFSYCASLTSVALGNSVTSIGSLAFYNCRSLTDVTIPNSVVGIGRAGFGYCTSLSGITVGPLNSVYSSAGGVLFNKTQTILIQYPGGKAGNYTIPNGATSIGDWAFCGCTTLANVTIGNSVTSIGEAAFIECTSLTGITIASRVSNIGSYAFYGCSSLTSVTIPNSVTVIGDDAFFYCMELAEVYFQGNAPSIGLDVFYVAENATVYYLPGTIGWAPTFGGLPTAPWPLPYPVILDFGPSFGMRTNQFGFIISWATNASVVIDASTNLPGGWLPVSTNTLTNGWSYFCAPDSSNYPARFYRIRSP